MRSAAGGGGEFVQIPVRPALAWIGYDIAANASANRKRIGSRKVRVSGDTAGFDVSQKT